MTRVLYKASVSRDLKKISPRDKARIPGRIDASLSGGPRAGDPLHGEFEGLFILRVGDYRIVYALVGQDVLVLRVRHRGSAYALDSVSLSVAPPFIGQSERMKRPRRP